MLENLTEVHKIIMAGMKNSMRTRRSQINVLEIELSGGLCRLFWI